jgi:hypothetical protein
VNLEEPALRFCCPDYLRQDSIRRPISSFETVLPASESAMPRSTMTANDRLRRLRLLHPLVRQHRASYARCPSGLPAWSSADARGQWIA